MSLRTRVDELEKETSAYKEKMAEAVLQGQQLGQQLAALKADRDTMRERWVKSDGKLVEVQARLDVALGQLALVATAAVAGEEKRTVNEDGGGDSNKGSATPTKKRRRGAARLGVRRKKARAST